MKPILSCLLLTAFAVALIATSGCSVNGDTATATPPNAVATAIVVTPSADGVIRKAVVWGLDHVDPQAYGGSWQGICPGTVFADAQRMKRLLESRGYQVVLLTNEQATAFRVTSACVAACSTMKDGDQFVAYGSSHGGQTPDLNGDENGGKDSTICLWDGQFTDDLVGEMLLRIKTKIDVSLILDCCNSGTMMRGPHDYVRVFRARQRLPTG